MTEAGDELGHTHLPMCRHTRTTIALNPGSVGQPLDIDSRASYAVIERGVAEIRRIAYDIEAAVAGIRAMRLPDDVIATLIAVLRTGKSPAGPMGGNGGSRSG